MQKYQIWYCNKTDSYSFFASCNSVAKTLKNHILLEEIEANSWEEACELCKAYIESVKK